jgi:hypothetical protein
MISDAKRVGIPTTHFISNPVTIKKIGFFVSIWFDGSEKIRLMYRMQKNISARKKKEIE